MGCGRTCRAKKRAKRAKKDAEAAQKMAENLRKNPPKIPGGPQPSSTNVTVITAGHVLEVHEKKGALTPREAKSIISSSRNNPKIKNSGAAAFIDPTIKYIDEYLFYFGVQKILTVAKPAAKMAVNIGGVVFNFANIGELLGDVFMLVQSVFMNMSATMMVLYKDIFFSYPIDIEFLAEYQIKEIRDAVSTSEPLLKESFLNAVKGFHYESLGDCEEMKRDAINSIMKSLDLNMKGLAPRIVDFGLSEEEEAKVASLSNDLLETLKKTEKVRAYEILKEVFNDNSCDVAEGDANLMIKDLKDKKNLILETRNRMDFFEQANEIVSQNKRQLISSISNAVSNIKTDSSPCIVLDTCYQESVSSDFTDLKTSIYNNRETDIDTTVVATTAEMIALRDLVITNSEAEINAEIITVDPSCQTDFLNSICRAIDCFKGQILRNVKNILNDSKVEIAFIDTENKEQMEQLNKEIERIVESIKKGILVEIKEVIMSEDVPCRSCKPCDQMHDEINDTSTQSINKAKGFLKKIIKKELEDEKYIWDIDEPGDVAIRKQQIKDALALTLTKNVGELNLFDKIWKKLRAEEEFLLDNVRKHIRIL